MIPRICVCCGEPMSEPANRSSDNPNLCLACSQFLDNGEEAAGLDQTTLSLFEAKGQPSSGHQKEENGNPS
jgi:hypothetical protein